MLRSVFLILVSAGCLAAQIRWKCDPKDGKFTMTPCANCKRLYCWDGQIFSEERGYTPPPAYVLSYWEEIHRQSEQMRADIDRKGKELREQYQRATEENARLNQERMQAHKAYMDDLNRRVAAGPPPPGSARGNTVASAHRAVPQTLVVSAPEPASSGPSPPPVSRAKVNEVQAGMDRAAVEGILGKPQGAISMPEDDKLVDLLTYTLEDHGTARVRIEQGKVASVKISD